jgi:hypothetical protein
MRFSTTAAETDTGKASSSKDPGKNPTFHFLTLSLLSVTTMSTASVTIFGVPRIVVFSLILTLYMFLRVGRRIDRNITIFSVAYCLAFIPGTIMSSDIVDLNYLSAGQLASALLTFSVTYTYMLGWFNIERRRASRQIQWILIIFGLSAIFELTFNAQFQSLKSLLFGLDSSDLDVISNRETELYGGLRPTAFFSEASNFARFIGMACFLYMALSQWSLGSMMAMIFFVAVTRSPSFFFGLPILASFMYNSLFLEKVGHGRVRKSIVILIPILLLLAGMISYTQLQRLSGMANGEDGSFDARIGAPLEFLATEWRSPIAGYGVTPAAPLHEFVLYRAISRGRKELIDAVGFRESLSTTIVDIVGMGAIGVSVFLLINFLFCGWQGVLLALVFELSNIMNGGSNSVTMFVPDAILLASCMYFWSCEKYDWT